MVNRIAKRINKQSFLNKVRIIYTLLVMLPVLVLEIFVLYSSTNFIKEQQLLEAKENIERNHLNIENQIKMCEKSVLYVTCNSVLREFLSLDDSEYKKRIQMTSNVNNLIYNAWLSNSYFSKMEVYSDKRISNNDAVFKKASDLEDNSWYEASWNSADTLWWNENGKYFITRRIAMAFPSDDGKPELEMAGPYGFGVFNNKDEAKIEAAKKFVQFVCDDQTTGIEAVKTTGFFPVHADWGDVYAGDADAETRAPFALMSDYLGRYYNLTGGWTEQRGYWWPMLAEIMTTGADVQTAADNFVQQANANIG